MEHESSPLIHAARFSFFGLGVLLFAWFAYLLSVGGFFFRPMLLVFGILISLGILSAGWKWLRAESWNISFLVFLTAAIATLTLFSAEPTIFSGRDQGSISEAAIELAHRGTLHFSSPASEVFFDIYGSGKALNFPGFSYLENGELTTQFPLGYVSFLGAFDSIFGINGFRAANGLLLFLSALSLFFLVRIFAGIVYGGFAWALSLVSFLPLWFSKFTLTENLALFLFAFLSLNLVLFLRENRTTFFLGSLLSASFLALTRIEGFWMLAVTLAILFFSKPGRSFFAYQPKVIRLVPLFFAGIMLAINGIANLPYYKTIGKALFKNTMELPGTATALLSGHSSTLLSLWKLFLAYGLFPVFILGLAGIIFLLWKRSFLPLLPALLALPTFWFLIDPSITPDHPWMLRRYLFSVWSTFLVSGVIATALFFSRRREAAGEDLFRITGKRRWAAPTLFLVLLVSGMGATIRTDGFSDNRGLLGELAPLAAHLGDNDLLLIDRDATGDPYAIPAGPLRFLSDKNAVYFFNPDDFAKIPQGKFDHIYLLTPLQNLDLWNRLPAELFFVDTIPFSTERFETLPLSDPRLPEKMEIEQDAVLFELKKL